MGGTVRAGIAKDTYRTDRVNTLLRLVSFWLGNLAKTKSGQGSEIDPKSALVGLKAELSNFLEKDVNSILLYNGQVYHL